MLKTFISSISYHHHEQKLLEIFQYFVKHFIVDFLLFANNTWRYISSCLFFSQRAYFIEIRKYLFFLNKTKQFTSLAVFFREGKLSSTVFLMYPHLGSGLMCFFFFGSHFVFSVAFSLFQSVLKLSAYSASFDFVLMSKVPVFGTRSFVRLRRLLCAPVVIPPYGEKGKPFLGAVEVPIDCVLAAGARVRRSASLTSEI